MKKAVITILGTISCWDGKAQTFDKKNKKAKYLVEDKLKGLINLKNENYTNMLPILIENFYNNKEYEIVPIYTSKAREIQEAVLKNCENFKNSNEIIDNIFNKGILLKDETDFKTILEEIDKKIKEYDEVIVDISHGFRHLPILMTIDLIVNSLKENNKIKNILFAEEIIQFKEYKIIDLTEYLELANLAFILSLFKENYSVSNHIKIKSPEYKKIVKLMREFSTNLMALSIEHLLKNVTPSLMEELQKLLEKKDIVFFEKEIKEIINILEKIYTFKSHRYETYYYIAKDVADDKKGYLAVAVSLIFEGASFYLYTEMKNYSNKTKEFFEKLEAKKDGKFFTDYDILNLCRRIFKIDKEDFKKNYKVKDLLTNDIKDELYNAKKKILKSYNYNEEIKYHHPLIRLIESARRLRNDLLHANSGRQIKDVKKQVNNLLKKYNKLIIKKA
jgi:CRISPR-associated DxTHG motif protein